MPARFPDGRDGQARRSPWATIAPQRVAAARAHGIEQRVCIQRRPVPERRGHQDIQFLRGARVAGMGTEECAPRIAGCRRARRRDAHGDAPQQARCPGREHRGVAVARIIAFQQVDFPHRRTQGSTPHMPSRQPDSRCDQQQRERGQQPPTRRRRPPGRGWQVDVAQHGSADRHVRLDLRRHSDASETSGSSLVASVVHAMPAASQASANPRHPCDICSRKRARDAAAERSTRCFRDPVSNK